MQHVTTASHDLAEQVPRRVGEHQEPLRVAGGRGNRPLVVRIAAHHSVQYDDIRQLDLVGRGGNVDEPALHSISQSGAFQQCGRGGLVFREISRFVALPAPRDSSSMWISPTPPPISNTEAPRMSWSVRNETSSRSVAATLAIAASDPPGEAVAEHGLVARPVAAVTHGQKRTFPTTTTKRARRAGVGRGSKSTWLRSLLGEWLPIPSALMSRTCGSLTMTDGDRSRL
jgi:hypothetical protein